MKPEVQTILKTSSFLLKNSFFCVHKQGQEPSQGPGLFQKQLISA